MAQLGKDPSTLQTCSEATGPFKCGGGGHRGSRLRGWKIQKVRRGVGPCDSHLSLPTGFGLLPSCRSWAVLLEAMSLSGGHRGGPGHCREVASSCETQCLYQSLQEASWRRGLRGAWLGSVRERLLSEWSEPTVNPGFES